MERHDSMTRAARYLMGTVALAGAMVAMGATNAGAATAECYRVFGEDPLSVCGHVYDSSGSELPGVTVAIPDGEGVNVASPMDSGPCDNALACGYYTFYVPEPGTYWVCVITDPNATDCSDTEKHPEAQPVTVSEGGHIIEFTIDSGSQNQEPPLVWGSGTGTPGYWKNHSAAWPVDSIVLGDPALQTWTLTKEQAIAFMSKPVAGDKTYTIFASLVSAMLNVFGDANNPACISAEIADAHHGFSIYGGGVAGVGSGVKAKSDAWVGGATNPFKAAEPIHTQMDDYNNGKLCAPHRN